MLLLDYIFAHMRTGIVKFSPQPHCPIKLGYEMGDLDLIFIMKEVKIKTLVFGQ